MSSEDIESLILRTKTLYYKNDKNLRVHVERFHRILVKSPCEKCEFEAESETTKEHVKEKNGDKSKNVTKIGAKNVNLNPKVKQT